MKSSFVKNAAVISLGGFAAKGIGVFYKIPLAALLGGYGLGLYQMAYPLFLVLLTFSSAGIPAALSRLVAEEIACGGDGRETFSASARLFALLGAAGTLCMAAAAPAVSGLQGDAALVPCYLMLAPSVFLVALIAVFRGYFQGKNDMAPTAVSEIVEQVVKTFFGLFLVKRFSAFGAASALFAVTLSEGAALLFLFFRFRAEPPRRMLAARKKFASSVLSSAFPVMAASSLLPLSKMVDSVLIVRLLFLHTDRAVSLYGLFTGGAAALVSIPATLCYGFVTAAVPAVSAACAHGDEEEGRRRAMRALLFTLALALPCAGGLFLLARPAVSVLFPALSAQDGAVLVSLVRLMSVSAATLAGVDTLSACLTGMGKAKAAALSMLAAVGVKFLLQFLLVSKPSLSVGGAAIAANACYLVAFFLDLFYTVRRKDEEKAHDNGREFGSGERRSHLAGA